MINPSQRKPINRFQELRARIKALGLSLSLAPNQIGHGWVLLNYTTVTSLEFSDLDAVEEEIREMENG